MKIFSRILVGLCALYIALFAIVFIAMRQTPERFGRFMRHAPAPVVWGALPAKKMWLDARGGHLQVGDAAPDFTLPLVDKSANVTLSSFQGKKPVVLAFGSYT